MIDNELTVLYDRKPHHVHECIRSIYIFAWHSLCDRLRYNTTYIFISRDTDVRRRSGDGEGGQRRGRPQDDTPRSLHRSSHLLLLLRRLDDRLLSAPHSPQLQEAAPLEAEAAGGAARGELQRRRHRRQAQAARSASATVQHEHRKSITARQGTAADEREGQTAGAQLLREDQDGRLGAQGTHGEATTGSAREVDG